MTRPTLPPIRDQHGDIDRMGNIKRDREEYRHKQDTPKPTFSASKPLVYLAGPYTNPDPVENMHRAIKIADGLLDVCTPVIPHLTGTWHMVSPKPYKRWLEIDLDYMRRCEVVFRFPGESSGADAEVEEAKRNNIPVVFSEDDLREWLRVNP